VRREIIRDPNRREEEKREPESARRCCLPVVAEFKGGVREVKERHGEPEEGRDERAREIIGSDLSLSLIFFSFF